MTRNVIVTAVVAVVKAGFVLAYTALVPAASRPAMGGMGGNAASVSGLPAVKGPDRADAWIRHRAGLAFTVAAGGIVTP